MVSRICVVVGVVIVATGCRHAAVPPPAAGERAAPEADCYQVESERFVFHSDPWINLHHFLYQWASASAERKPGDTRPPVEVPEMEGARNLAEGERQAWERAVAYYRERLIGGDLLADRDLVGLKEQLSALACTSNSANGIDPELWKVLVEAMPVYRRHWWPEHHAANVGWIGERLRQLRSYETVLAQRLAEAYGGEWPAERIRVDVAAYSNWAGAYTTNNPNRLTISSTSYEGLGGLEIVFHEVSHASFFEQRIFEQVATAFRPHGVKPPGRLFHVIQFVTPAELIRSLLGNEQPKGYRSIAERVYPEGPAADQYRIVLKYWKPFLDGKIDRTEALDCIATEIAQQRDSR